MSWLTRALRLAALFGLVIAGFASCAPAGTETPSPAATAAPRATAVPPVAGTATAAPTATSVPVTPTPTPPPGTPTTAPGAAACAVGERCERGGIALTVNSVSTTDTLDNFPTPQAGNTFLVLNATIVNVSHDGAPYNPLSFKVRAADGTEYDTTFVAPSPSLKSGTLSRGDRVRGNVAFEMPTDASGLMALYEPLVVAGGFEEIRVNLGR